MLGCTFKCKPIKKSIKTHHLCLEWGVLSLFLLFFSTKVSYSLVDMSLDTWYLGFFTCFHVSLSQKQECDKNPPTPSSSLDIYVYACLVFRNFLTDVLFFSVQFFCPQPSVFVLLSTKILFKNLIFKANTWELYNLE